MVKTLHISIFAACVQRPARALSFQKIGWHGNAIKARKTYC